VETLCGEQRRAAEADTSNTCIRHGEGAPSAALDFWLVDRDFIYPLKVGINTLGRSGDNDVVVEDLYVSRRHCAILVHHDRTCVLHDTASKNGTYLNGVKVAGPAPIKPGDEVRICNRQFVFLSRNSPAAAPPPAGPVTQTLAE
jgi:pSer/pThr/pTyr-binding forkhead associated (FHA) protein